MKNKNVPYKLLYYLFVVIIILELILIAHRSTFSINNLFNFTKESTGLEQGIKNKKIYTIISLINKNRISEFNLSNELYKSKYNQAKIHTKMFQRVVEASYPSKLNEKSKIIFTSNKSLYSKCKKIDQEENIYVFNCK